jgi:hypothetical protein
MRFSPNKVAVALADRLSEVLPTGFEVAGEGGLFKARFSMEESSWTEIEVAAILQQDSEDPFRDLESAAYCVLSNVQDLVSTWLHVPWPPSSSDRARMALPQAAVVNEVLQLSYVDGDVRALELAGIALTQIAD